MRPKRASTVYAGPVAVGASLFLHAGVLVVGGWGLARGLSGSEARRPDPPRIVELDLTDESDSTVRLPTMSMGGLRGPPAPASDRVPRETTAGGGITEPRPDSWSAGGGGDDRSADPAVNLADQIDGITLDPDPINHLARSQVQRLRTANQRRSWDDRRATPHPMQLSFLATGLGERPERRPRSRFEPSRGVDAATRAQSRGSILGGPPAVGDGPEKPVGGPRRGSARDVSAAGVVDGSGRSRPSRAARVALARPDVPRARAAVPARRRGRPSDTIDSSQEVASAVRALVHASAAGGRRGAGVGGRKGGRFRGYGGDHRDGSRSRSAGRGGFPGALGDPLLIGYLRDVQRRVDPQWVDAFPTWAIAEGRGGLAVVALTILRDGTLREVRVARGSGIAEFDRNVVAAVRRAAPFRALPATLGRGRLSITVSFDARNPVVGRDGRR